MTEDEPAPHQEPQEPIPSSQEPSPSAQEPRSTQEPSPSAQELSPSLPWENEETLNHQPFNLQPECPSLYIDPLSFDGATTLPFGLGAHNDAAISRILAIGSGDINLFNPVPSPVSVEAPFSGAGFAVKCRVVDVETSSSVSHFELPAGLVGQCTVKEAIPKDYQLKSSLEAGNTPEKIVLTPITEVNNNEMLADGFVDPNRFAKASTDEVRRILRISGCDLVFKISQYWCHYHQFLKKMEERVYHLLKDRGVKIKRRKRMGPEVPAFEKKEIRAQRNRERSQSLRKHHKQRLMDLEGAGEQMRVYNSATRSLINCVLEDEAALPLLHTYFTKNEYSESLLSYLSNDF